MCQKTTVYRRHEELLLPGRGLGLLLSLCLQAQGRDKQQQQQQEAAAGGKQSSDGTIS
jgi:hypothetical protein